MKCKITNEEIKPFMSFGKMPSANGFLEKKDFKSETFYDMEVGFSEKISRKLAFAPHINIGVFSLEKNSPCWKVWQDNLRFALKKGNIFGSEGLAINISVYINNIKTEFLPLKCNWIASNLLPKYDEINGTFVEPYLPNNKIGIMHLAAGLWKNNKDMRIDKNVAIDIETLDGNIISKSLRFD